MGRLALAGALLIVIVAAAIVATSEDAGDEQIRVSAGPAAVLGGRPAERAIAAHLLRGFGAHRRITRVRIGTRAPDGFTPRRDGVWLAVAAASREAPTSRAYAQWQADVLADSMRRSARAAGLRPVRGVDLQLALPDGEIVNESAGILGLEASGRQASREDLARLLGRGAAAARVDVVQTWFANLDLLAMAARLVTHDGERFVCEADERLAALTRPFVDGGRALAGVYLEVGEENGDPVLAYGNGYIRVREDLGERYPPETADPSVRQRYYELCGGRPPTSR